MEEDSTRGRPKFTKSQTEPPPLGSCPQDLLVLLHYQDHAGFQGGNVAVVAFESRDGGLVGVGD